MKAYHVVGEAPAELKEQWHARLWCEKADLGGGQFFPLQAADSGYEEGGVIKVDEMEFTAWHTPGHTPGSVCLLCGQYLFTGDTLFAGSVGRTDLPGGSTRQMAGAGPAGARGPFHLWGGAETQLVHQERVQTGLTQP